MKRAVLAAVLWYVALWSAGGTAEFLLGLPTWVGMALGMIIAGATIGLALRARRTEAAA